MKKIFVVGEARHGKDTFAEYLQKHFGPSFVSSSLFVSEKAVYPSLKDKYGYSTLEECFDDRFNHRAEWKDLISKYNEGDLSRLSRELFAQHDIYVGIRCRDELEEAKYMADLVVWVDRSEILPPEKKDSMTITRDQCDIIVDNNGSLSDLEVRAIRLGGVLYTSNEINWLEDEIDRLEERRPTF